MKAILNAHVLEVGLREGKEELAVDCVAEEGVAVRLERRVELLKVCLG
jgi:hypothetical protein